MDTDTALKNYTTDELRSFLDRDEPPPNPLKRKDIRQWLEKQVQQQVQQLTSVAEHAILSAIRTLRAAREWSVSGRSNAMPGGVQYLEGVLTDMRAVMHMQGWQQLHEQGGHPSGADAHAMDRPLGTGFDARVAAQTLITCRVQALQVPFGRRDYR